MSRNKKSRKVGQIGVPSVAKQDRTHSSSDKKPKKKTGNTSGSRHSVAKETKQTGGSVNKDPRLGSKKPIPLVVEKKTTKEKKQTFFSPSQELDHIENDARLAQLLDKADSGKKLSTEQQEYVDNKLARHKVLCQLLGIEDEVEEEDEIDGDDPFDQLDSSDLDAFKRD